MVIDYWIRFYAYCIVTDARQTWKMCECVKWTQEWRMKPDEWALDYYIAGWRFNKI